MHQTPVTVKKQSENRFESFKPKGETASKNAPATGKGSKSGELNRRGGGDSDDEMQMLTARQMREADLKLDIKPKRESDRGLSEADKLAAVSYITTPEVWKDWRLKQLNIFIHVSGYG